MYNKCKKQQENDQQIIKNFDKFFRRRIQYSVVDKNESESLCDTFTKNLDETRNEPFF